MKKGIIEYRVETLKKCAKRTGIPISDLLKAQKGSEEYCMKTGVKLLNHLVNNWDKTDCL